MASSLSIKIGNILFHYAFPLYKILYQSFKIKQDAYEISLLKRYVKDGDVVLDIGANIGFYTEYLSKLVGQHGHIHAFEPDQTNFKHLKNRVGALAHVTINNQAVADKTQELKIYTSKELNVDHRTYKPDHYDQEITISAVSIDEYISSKPVHFIKMDIQGFEMAAVSGMKKTLQNNDVKMISEFWPYGMKKAGHSVLEYFHLLKSFHFFIYLIKDEKLIELTEADVQKMLDLPKTIYMNIFVSKSRV